MIYKMTLKDSADEMTFDLLEVPIVDKDIEGVVDNVTLDGNQYTDYLWLKKQFVQKWSILCDDEYTRLRGFYTRQFENADVPSYRLYYGDDIIRNSTLSGERIELSISGVADGTMSLTQMDGNIEQDGTPTPSAPVPVQTVTGRQTVTVAGKNLLPPIVGATTNGVTISIDGNGHYKLSGTATADTTFAVALPFTLARGTYRTMSFNVIGGAITGTSTVRYRIRDTNGSYSGGPDIAEITVSSNSTGRLTKVIRNELKTLNIWVANGCTCSNYTFTVQLENGQTATTFEPYNGQSYDIDLGSIELCKIGTYQDKVYKENGKWWLHKEIGRYDITGAENWTRSGRTTSTVFAGVLANDALTAHMQIGANECFNNRFIYKGATVEAGGYDVYNYSSAGVVRAFVLYVSVDSASDITAFKTWLTNNPTTVYYVLATPTTTEITNEALVEELEALQDEAISVGLHNIYTDTPNALPTLTFDLTEYLSKSTTIIPETAVRLTLTDGGVINTCGCRKDVQLTMRETIE